MTTAGGNARSDAALYELAFARWHRPEYGRLAATSNRREPMALLYGEPALPEGPFIPQQSVLMKNAGFALLRSQGEAVAVRFGMHGGGHGHPDKLNLVTYGSGHLFGLDPGSINYGVPLHREWYRTTIAHNTVAVDSASQAAVDGQLEDWGEDRLSARVEGAYPGVVLRRGLKLASGTLQDRFECSSSAEHDYDYAFHAAGRFRSSLEFKPCGPLAYAHLDGLAEARVEGDWWAEWEQDGARYRLKVKGEPGTVVFSCAGPGRDPAERVPMVIIRRHGRQTVYDCTHVFGPNSSAW